MTGLRRLLTGIVWTVVVLIGGAIAVVVFTPDTPATRPASTAAAPPSAISTVFAANPVVAAIRSASAGLRGPSADCAAPGFEAAAQANGLTLTTLAWAPFHRPETGWAVYAPRISQEIQTTCPPDSAAFAQALARWQGVRRLPATGQLDGPTFGLMSTSWELARPFVRLSQTGVCPPAPADTNLAWALPDEGYARKPIQLRPGVLTAYRQMVADARAASPAIAADHRLLSIFSGYRSPDSDAARCARDNNCENITRAACSAHRTGLAMDIYLGAAPGSPPELSDDANRLYQSKSAAYAWMIANAARYGFVNYPFEPWHWEWTGEPQ
jgi:D-alanyl-D-alanine carboxypeptidase